MVLIVENTSAWILVFIPPGGEWIWSLGTDADYPDWDGPHCFTIGDPSGVDLAGDNLPNSFSLSQNYPNPFKHRPRPLSLMFRERIEVKVKVYNVLGQEVTTLVDEVLARGSYKADWDGTASDGSKVSSGVYFYKMEAGDFSETKKMMLVK